MSCGLQEPQLGQGECDHEGGHFRAPNIKNPIKITTHSLAHRAGRPQEKHISRFKGDGFSDTEKYV